MKPKIIKYDMHANIILSRLCNFQCDYCYVPFKKIIPSKMDIKKLTEFFDKSKKTWFLQISGGEPFLYPKFIELCEKLTKKHYISINTNLSDPTVYDFIEKINPEKVASIIASLHILEIEKKDLKKDFIDKIKRLKDKNFNIPVTMVIWPPLIKEMDTIFKEFADKEIYILPRAFTGIFKNKRYPESYTEEESKKLEFYNQIYEKNKKPNSIKIIKKDTSIKTNKGKNRFYGELSFQGAPCLAGSKHIVIHENGEVMKCFSNNSSLGNIFKGKINLFDKPQICDSKKCYCFHEGLLFSLKNPKILGGKSLEDIRVSIQSLSKKLNKLK